MKKETMTKFRGGVPFKGLIRRCFGAMLTPASSKAAFTLAEVLITLGIIGVVSAMTIPNLMMNYQKKVFATRLKQTSALVAQGVRQFMADEDLGDLHSSGSFDLTSSNNAEVARFAKKYFKVQQDCNGKYKPCFGSGKYTSLDGKRGYGLDGSCQFVGTLINGVSICLDMFTENNTFMGVEVDLNGPAMPNRFGVDMFQFQVAFDGHIFDAKYEENGFYHIDWGCCFGAYGKVAKDGWEIKYPINGSIKDSDYEPKEKSK